MNIFLENILLNIFKFYILEYIIKFLQSRDNNNNKKNSASINSRNSSVRGETFRRRTLTRKYIEIMKTLNCIVI